ncbi:Mucosal pentraxin, partial [Mesitornis unicolor]
DLQWKAFIFPQETKGSLVLVRVKPAQPLLNFTVCLCSFTDLSHPYSLFSYATKEQSKEILLHKHRPGEYHFYVGGEFLTFHVPLSFVESEHVCVSWESTTGIVGFWFNGKPWPRKGLQKGYTVGAKGVIVLGQEQEQEQEQGSFGTQWAFAGEISSVYMWDVGIITRQVHEAMQDRFDDVPLFGWTNFPYKLVGEVYLKP